MRFGRWGARELMRMHVEALFEHDADGRMTKVNEPGGGPAPALFVGRTTEGDVLHLHQALSAPLSNALRSLVSNAEGDPLAPVDPGPFVEALGDSSTERSVWTGPAYVVPSDLPDTHPSTPVGAGEVELLRAHFADWMEDVEECQPFVARVVDGVAVSICASVRISEEAHEAGVETAEGWRGRGHAGEVVTAWARAVYALGRVPLYSTSWTNTASRAVASKLRLPHFGSDLHVT